MYGIIKVLMVSEHVETVNIPPGIKRRDQAQRRRYACLNSHPQTRPPRSHRHRLQSMPVLRRWMA